MGARVVCISRTIGAGGEEVGRSVAAALGFRYLDDEVVEIAAEKAGMSVEAVADAERHRSLVERVLEALIWSGAASVTPPVTASDVRMEPEAAQIRAVVRELTEEGNAVIVAHAASFAVGDRGTALRVLVTAPPEVRALRIASEAGLSKEKALASIRESDVARAAYLRRFYSVAEELPTHYDLVVNTEHLTTEDAAALVVQLSAADPIASA